MKRRFHPDYSRKHYQLKKKAHKNQSLSTTKKPQKDDFFISESEGENDVKQDPEIEIVDDNEDPIIARNQLMKEFINQVEDPKDSEIEDNDTYEKEDENENLLKEDFHKNNSLRQICSDFKFENISVSRTMRGHRHPITSLKLSSDDTTIYSSAKDGTIIRYDVETGKQVSSMKNKRIIEQPPHPGAIHAIKKHQKQNTHSTEVLTLSLSYDSKFLVSGGRDKMVHIWDTRSNTLIHSLKGHRDSVTSLTFRKNTLELFSGSSDSTIKLWSLENMSYIETLFGHTSDVLTLDSLYMDRCLSSGGQDKSCRLWKIPQSTHWVYNTQHASSLDSACLVNENTFLTGSDDGSVSLWSASKKKPWARNPKAHSHGCWVSALCGCPFTDIAASGSSDGQISLWEIRQGAEKIQSQKSLSLTKMSSVPLNGVINTLEFSSSGKFLVAATAPEHRLGRWFRCTSVNGICLIPIS